MYVCVQVSFFYEAVVVYITNANFLLFHVWKKILEIIKIYRVELYFSISRTKVKTQQSDNIIL